MRALRHSAAARVVEMPGRDPAMGFFSLTMQRTPAGWRIVHDHSS